MARKFDFYTRAQSGNRIKFEAKKIGHEAADPQSGWASQRQSSWASKRSLGGWLGWRARQPREAQGVPGRVRRSARLDPGKKNAKTLEPLQKIVEALWLQSGDHLR